MAKNTLHSGSIRALVFRDGERWHAVALELNISETGDDPREVILMLDEAVRGYLETVAKEKLDNAVLNQKPDPVHEKLWNSFTSRTKSVPSVYSANLFSLSAFAR